MAQATTARGNTHVKPTGNQTSTSRSMRNLENFEQLEVEVASELVSQEPEQFKALVESIGEAKEVRRVSSPKSINRKDTSGTARKNGEGNVPLHVTTEHTHARRSEGS